MNRKSPKQSATLFNMHIIKKGLDGNLYIISKRINGVKYWKKTNNEEKKCRSEFEKNKNITLREYKEGKYVSNKQAIAIAYSKTYKKNKNCEKYLGKKSQNKSNKKSNKKPKNKSNKKPKNKSKKKIDCRRKENKKKKICKK
jgi:hypothetical protein